MIRPFHTAALIAGLLLSAAPLRAEERTTIDGLDVAAWAPEPARYADAAKPPIVIFSHGYTGCAQQSTFLMEALAQAGYAVFAVNHGDAHCGNPVQPPKHPMRDPQLEETPQAWNDSTFANRRDDLKELVAAIEKDDGYKEQFDTKRIALVGHSMGGMGVLAAAGGRGDWNLDDGAVKAVVALSPFVQPLLANGSLEKIDVPTMYQGGTQDPRFTPAVDKTDGAYDKTPEPKYFVEFDGANHASWTQLSPELHDPIARYTIAFLDRYVKGDRSADLILHEKDTRVAVLRYATPEGKMDEDPRPDSVDKPAARSQPNPSGQNPGGRDEKGTVRERFRAKPFAASPLPSGVFGHGFSSGGGPN